MLEIKRTVARAIANAIDQINGQSGIGEAEITLMLEYPPDSKMGDLALPCFKLSRTLRMSPVKIADTIADGFCADFVARAEAVNGYLNIFLDTQALATSAAAQIFERGDAYGAPDMGKGKTVVLDYSSPNVAKPFHIGHLGTTVIGHSLKKLHEFAGYNCVGINYLGDWGTQFGKLIVAYRLWGDRQDIESGGIDKLVELYVRFHKEAEEDPSLNDRAREEFRKLEDNDTENIELWQYFVQISLKEYQKTYSQLSIEFDSYKGESFYTDKMPAQVQKLRDMDLLKIDDGASIVDLEEYGMPPCLILKRDGSTLYPTRDIAAAVYRKQTYDFDKAIYVTSAGQSLHFAQWFKVVELMGYDWYDKLVHVPYGTVSINGEKLATRTGNVILLRDLFALAVEKIEGIMKEKNPDLEGREKIAEQIGVGAVVFYYLSNNRIKDINFVMEDALNFDGNTGPYVQYTYARCCSVLSKATESFAPTDVKVSVPEEAELVKVLMRFEENVRDAIATYEPSVITRYILDVASAYNRFYHNCSILGADDEQVRKTRLALTLCTKTVLGNAFGLVCLAKTEKV